MRRVEFGDTVVNSSFEFLDAVCRNHSRNLGRGIFCHGRAQEGLVSVVDGEHSPIERVCDGLAIGETASEADGQCFDRHGDGLVTV